jgi:tRNA(Ile)-lysidine synthase
VPAIIGDAALLSAFAHLEQYPTAALAVSGGPDSLALMHLARRWIALKGRRTASMAVVTVDHQLRPESESEAAFVARRAEQAGFPHAVLKWTGRKPETGIQAAARSERYRLLTAYCHEKGLACLVTAHTEDDQAETLLMRLRRGSGLDGLAAMAPLSEQHGLPIVRPLLRLSKGRLTAYLRASGLPFVHDSSNENTAFERVRLRHAMKALAAAGIARPALAKSALRLGRSRNALAILTDDFLRGHFHVTVLGRGELQQVAINALPPDLALRAIGQMLALVGGTQDPPRLSKLESLLPRLASDRLETTLGRCLIVARRGTLYFYREPGRLKPAPVLVERGGMYVWDGRYLLTFASDPPCGAIVRQLGPDGWLVYRKAMKLKNILAQVDRLAALSTPALWIGNSLVCTPSLGFANDELVPRPPPPFAAQFLPQLARFLNPI